MRWGGETRQTSQEAAIGEVLKEVAEESLAYEPVLLGCLGLACSPPSKPPFETGVLVMG